MIFCTKENSKNISFSVSVSFDKSVDVVVVGLGTAGSIAAIAAGREGKSVIGIEPNTYMGGVGTGGGIHSYCCGTKGGLQDEIDEKCRNLEPHFLDIGARGFHPDVKKYILEEEALKAKVDLWYQTAIIGVYMEGNQVVGVQVNTADGLQNISSKAVIDCSGDGEVCAMANCSFRLGRDSDGLPQPYSFPRGYMDGGHITAANFDAGYVDPTNGDAMSKAICHSQSLHVQDNFTDENRYLYTASHLGLREGRFIIGEDSISFSDLIHMKEVPNLIFQARAFHDNHTRDWAFESVACQFWVSLCGFWYRPTVANVPYGVIVPKGVEGLLVAGRCISIDHDAAQTFRMQRDMQKLGEVAGLAAAIAIDKGVAAKDVPYELLKAKLLASGCLTEKLLSPPPFEKEEDRIKTLLSSSKNGEGIWSAYLNYKTIKTSLHEWVLDTENEHLQKNTAMALGMRKDSKALPVLRKMVETRDTYYFEKMHRAQQRQLGATFLLGEMCDEGIFLTFLSRIADKTSDFQVFSQTMVALLKMGEKNKTLRNEICKTFENRFNDATFFYDLAMQISVGKTQVVENYTNYLKIFAGKAFKKWGEECVFLNQLVEADLSDRDKTFLNRANAS